MDLPEYLKTIGEPAAVALFGEAAKITMRYTGAGTAYLTVDAHQENNRDPWVYRTSDVGRTWKLSVSGVPKSPLSYAHVIREDPVRRGLLDFDKERAVAERYRKSLRIKTSTVDAGVTTLSGGNQQKVVLARWLLRDCRVLLLDEPTRGVDVGARAEIYRLIRRLAADGSAVVLVSSELEEVLQLSDEVLVLADGRVVHQGPAADIDEHRILDLVMEGTHA